MVTLVGQIRRPAVFFLDWHRISRVNFKLVAKNVNRKSSFARPLDSGVQMEYPVFIHVIPGVQFPLWR